MISKSHIDVANNFTPVCPRQHLPQTLLAYMAHKDCRRSLYLLHNFLFKPMPV